MTAIPLADAPRLRRIASRTRALRLTIAALLVVCALLAALAARRPAISGAPFLPAGSNGIVVLDLSASISTDTHQQIADTLAQLAASRGRYGLVVFSSTAYEALPPETPARELGSLVRFFRVVPGRNGYGSTVPTTPWTQSFSFGTAISRGLELGYQLVRQDRLLHPSLLLISDLSDDPGDLRRVASTALALRRAHIPVHVVALSAATSDTRLFARLLGSSGSITAAGEPGTTPAPATARLPLLLILAPLFAAALLAVAELFFPPFRFRTAT